MTLILLSVCFFFLLFRISLSYLKYARVLSLP
jgi:hypothetical protein